uniref:SH2 domain-containing protein n=1 Tax=Rhabditophanes sp. KR3021 TaxID=114890 RepID=A0AC35TNM4_9BILA
MTSTLMFGEGNNTALTPSTSFAPIATVGDIECHDQMLHNRSSSLSGSTSTSSSDSDVGLSSVNHYVGKSKSAAIITSHSPAHSYPHSEAQDYISMMSETMSPKTLCRIKQLKVIMESENNGEVIHHHPIFVRDTSKYWYKPAISREDAINMLKDKSPGTFVVRDSNSFPGAFGLALKVSAPPPGVNVTDGTELVRHFLIEPSPKGVRLKGCANEPVFGTLAALVYQHSITALALPTKLLLPEFDSTGSEHLSATQALLEQGAACNVVYVCSIETESLTGPEALRRSVAEAFRTPRVPQGSRGVSVHFKVSSQGITLTDNTRTLFFRRHYPVQSVTYAGVSDSQCISYGMSGNSPNNAITFIGVGGADETRSFGGNTYPEGFPRQIDPEDRK